VGAVCGDRYLVLSIFTQDTAYNRLGGAGYDAIMYVNSVLAYEYGLRYFDLLSYIVDQYNPDIPQDVIDHGNNVPPSSFRADTIHLNTEGSILALKRLILRADELGFLHT
jgi:hypothetical protein